MVAPAVGLERGGGEQGTGPGERHDMAGMGGLSALLSYLEAKERSKIEHLRWFERRAEGVPREQQPRSAFQA
jgi:hypothetical protein